ncbi:MAG: hypothetical protein JWM21_2859 [Acidobacteria bacterium]|nr:hypothetical protein [Acidobacteriota bacterium]
MTRQKFPSQLIIAAAVLELGLLVYSQAVAYWGDESLHLVAGQLMNAGKRPYLDFFYHHPPLFLYLISGLMRVFGENWRVVHIASALLSGGCLLLTGSYVFSRIHNEKLRVRSAAIAAFFVGVNSYVISFGTVALPYGFCLFFMTAAFVLVTVSVDRPNSIFAFWGGLCAAAAAAAYLLTAPVILVLFIWMMLYNRNGKRFNKSVGYVLGAAIAFVPLLSLARHSPQQVWFDLVQYHLFHRAGSDLGLWFNLREIAGWFISIQGAILLVLAAIGTRVIKCREEADERLGSELRLLTWLIVALGLVISIARPTSSFYFVLITPFLAMLAACGVCRIQLRVTSRIGLILMLLIGMLYVAGLSSQRYIWRRQTSYTDHRIVANIAGSVSAVTASAGMIYAFEAVYFEAHRLPPPGLENRFNPNSQADEWLAAGRFDTVCIGSTNPGIATSKLLEHYAKRQTINMNGQTFYILWDRMQWEK